MTAEILILAIPFGCGGAYVGFFALKDWLENRRESRDRAENARMKRRLPPHERCDCVRCVEWRAKFSETLREGA